MIGERCDEEAAVVAMRYFRWWVAIWALCMGFGALASSAAKEGEGEGEAKGASEYVAITPAIVANYGTGGMRYMKADIVLRVPGGPPVQARVIHHLPYLRHALVMLFSDQTDESLSSMAGKEQLRQNALTAVQQILKEEEGKPLVVDLLFNSFVVQR